MVRVKVAQGDIQKGAMMLAFETATEIRADEILPGDVLDTRCGIGELAWSPVLQVRVIEDDNPRRDDRIEVTIDTTSISNTRVYSAARIVRVIPKHLR